MSRSLEVWLQQHGLSHLAEVLTAASVDLDILDALSESDLEGLGISLGDRKRLLRAVASDLPRGTASASAERRMITVMFVDLVDFTAMSRALDPEDLRAATRSFQSVCADAVQQLDGSIAQYLGDGILAYFGYPRAHEDDAERAVRTAFTILDRMPSRVTGTQRKPLSVRIGVATGLVVVDDVVEAELVRGQAAVGEAPNVAARLQTLAEPGTVLVSEATRRLLSRAFQIEALSLTAIKGLSGPQQVYRVIGEQPIMSRFESRTGPPLSPLIGRKAEMSALWQAWRSATVNRGRMVLLRGEAGMGKSRLCVALQDSLTQAGYAVALLQCSPHHTGTPYYALARYIEQAANLQSLDHPGERLDRLNAWLALSLADDPETLTQASSAVGTLLSLPGVVPMTGPPAMQRRVTQQVLRQLLLGAAAQSPVLLILEDVHWIDPTTAEWMASVAEPIGTSRLLVVATARPGWTPAWSCEEVLLDPLGAAHAHDLLHSTLRGQVLPNEQVEHILSKCDGVPLFIEEMTLSVLESTDLATGAVEVRIPQTLQESLTARFDRLGSAREVLQVGAAIGREFERPMLAEALGWSEERLAAALDWVSRSGLLHVVAQAPDAIYMFKHALIQEVAYSTLLLASRKQLHGKIAQIIEQRFPELRQRKPAVLARHLESAGETMHAIEAWVEAGSQEAAVAASAEAVQHFERALTLLREHYAEQPESDEATRAELDILIKLGPVVMMARGIGSEHSARTYERARELVIRTGDQFERFVVAFSLWYAYENQCRHTQTDTMLLEVDQLAEASSDARLLVQARHARWTTSLNRGLFTECLQSTQEGIDHFQVNDRPFHIQRFGGHDPYLCALSHRQLSLWHLGDPQGGDRLADASLAQSIELQHLPTRIISTFGAVWMYQQALQAERIRPVADPVIALCDRAGIAQYSAILNIFSGWADAALTRDPATVDFMSVALSRFEASGSRLRLGLFETLMADACLMTGRLKQGFRHITLARQHIEQHGEFGFRCYALVTEGSLHEAHDDLGAAEHHYLRAIEVARSQQALSLELRAARLMAELLGRTQRADQGLSLLSPLVARFPESLETVDLAQARAWMQRAPMNS
jgi:class 3 adenylate cyclase